jgi:hypothetical protein
MKDVKQQTGDLFFEYHNCSMDVTSFCTCIIVSSGNGTNTHIIDRVGRPQNIYKTTGFSTLCDLHNAHTGAASLSRMSDGNRDWTTEGNGKIFAIRCDLKEIGSWVVQDKAWIVKDGFGTTGTGGAIPS